MNIDQYVETAIRPRLQGDGGEVRFAEQKEDRLTLVFQGECSKCLILERCVAWIEQQIAHDLGEQVHIVAVRKKPYFWDV